MNRDRAVVVGLVVGGVAAGFQAWWLYSVLGFGFWFLALVVPVSLMTLQFVGSGVAKVLMELGSS